mgnify:CR=1 FL=1
MTKSLGIMMLIRIIPALGKMIHYIRGEIAAASAGERKGLLVDLVHAEADGERMSEDELVAMIAILFVAGHETTTHLLSTGVATLLAHPAALEELKADWSLAPTGPRFCPRSPAPTITFVCADNPSTTSCGPASSIEAKPC